MKGIIIYKGKYGATRQYAEWLSETLRLPVASTTSIKKQQLDHYDFFIIGSSVYIGKLLVRNWLRSNLPWLSRKKIFFYQVAGAPPEETEKRTGYNRSGIPQELAVNAETFFLPGRMQFKRLSWSDRFLLRMGARLSKDPEEKKHMLQDYDGVRFSSLTPLLTSVNRYQATGQPGRSQSLAIA